MAPVEYQALMERREESLNESQVATAQLACMVARILGGDKARQIEVADFLPFKAPQRFLTIEEAEQSFRSLEERTRNLVH